jgi:alpha-amylase
MDGQIENIQIAPNGETVIVNRGNKGAALVNFSANENQVSLATTLPDGSYTDTVHGKSFTVSNGVLNGTASAHETYIIVKR